MFAALITAGAALITSVAVLVSVLGNLKGQRQIMDKVAGVHQEVKTQNGITLAVLADRAEGRRIQSDLLPSDRTEKEQDYVDKLEEGGRDL